MAATMNIQFEYTADELVEIIDKSCPEVFGSIPTSDTFTFTFRLLPFQTADGEDKQQELLLVGTYGFAQNGTMCWARPTPSGVEYFKQPKVSEPLERLDGNKVWQIRFVPPFDQVCDTRELGGPARTRARADVRTRRGIFISYLFMTARDEDRNMPRLINANMVNVPMHFEKACRDIHREVQKAIKKAAGDDENGTAGASNQAKAPPVQRRSTKTAALAENTNGQASSSDAPATKAGRKRSRDESEETLEQPKAKRSNKHKAESNITELLAQHNRDVMVVVRDLEAKLNQEKAEHAKLKKRVAKGTASKHTPEDGHEADLKLDVTMAEQRADAAEHDAQKWKAKYEELAAQRGSQDESSKLPESPASPHYAVASSPLSWPPSA